MNIGNILDWYFGISVGDKVGRNDNEGVYRYVDNKVVSGNGELF